MTKCRRSPACEWNPRTERRRLSWKCSALRLSDIYADTSTLTEAVEDLPMTSSARSCISVTIATMTKHFYSAVWHPTPPCCWGPAHQWHHRNAIRKKPNQTPRLPSQSAASTDRSTHRNAAFPNIPGVRFYIFTSNFIKKNILFSQLLVCHKSFWCAAEFWIVIGQKRRCRLIL